jgi:eukaryotic-like serine/threonine-protein kinase
MNLEKWAKVKAIFNAALELPDADREVFIESNCGADETLFLEVKSLLEAERDAKEFIEAPAFSALNRLIGDTQNPSRVGQIIGAYKLEKEIGRGGMGAVYLGSRADAEFKKRVAVKLIKRGLDTDEIVRRFRYERQILATLDHPNITRLIDGGATDDGSPYLVMDYVEGKPLTKYADERQLSIEERLRLFLQICAAVQYAHQNLIIHRDLKPSNILVTNEGVPKLLDFGIAKLLTAGNGGLTLEKSLTATQAMTPEYASPEQITGKPVTTASDIYSLGVVLYELLTGHRPIRLTSRSQEELSRIITDTSPPKPSESDILRRGDAETRRRGESDLSAEKGFVAAPPRLPFSLSQLKGDLDNIVLMAMRKEPTRRYSSVEQFAGDIKRYLSGLPVIAREDSFSYRASKFVQRNKAGVAAVSGIALSLIGGIIATLRQSRIAARERDAALAEAEKAERINRFLQKMLASADPRRQGKDVKVAEILELAAESMERDFAGEPEIIADLQTTIGLTFLSQGKLNLAERHLRQALETRLKLFGRDHYETAISFYNYGQLMEDVGDASAAENCFRQAIKTLHRLPGNNRLEISNVLHNLAHVAVLQGKNAEAVQILSEVLEIRRALLNENHPKVAETLAELGNTFTVLGDTDAAERLQRQALAVMRQHYGNEHPDTALILVNLFAAIQHRKPAEAELLIDEALRIRRKILGDTHLDVAWTLYHLSFMKINRGEAVEAERLTREVLNLRGTTLTDENLLVSNVLLILGRSLMAQDRLTEAETVLRECLALRQKNLSPEHWVLATTSGFLGECLMLLNQRETGMKLLLESYESLKEKLGENHMQTQMAAARVEKFLG